MGWVLFHLCISALSGWSLAHALRVGHFPKDEDGRETHRGERPIEFLLVAVFCGAVCCFFAALAIKGLVAALR